jgi:hypothetical protein
MPARTFRVVISNACSFLTLNQTFNHLCGGDWTPGGWTPPNTISPGTSGGIQAESNRFMSGTEGYVKYDVRDANDKRGMVYVYWNNPFYGITYFRAVTAADDVEPDCDYSGGGGPPAPAKVPFMITQDYKLSSDSPDVDHLLNSFVVGPIEFFGKVGINEHPELDITVSDDLSGQVQVFGTASLGPVNLRLLTRATTQQWVGKWANGAVSLDIVPAGSGELSANVHDGSTAPPFSLIETFAPGAANLFLAQESSIRRLLDGQVQGSLQRAAFAQAAKSVIEQVGQSPFSVSATAKRFQSLVGDVQTNSPADLIKIKAKAGVVGRVLGALVQGQGGVGYLSNHIALWLFGEFQSGRQTGTQLQFQRLDPQGNVVTNLTLKFVPHIT